MNYSSNCQCGNIEVYLSLPQRIELLEPRRCDCGFCKSHELIFLSEPKGTLNVEGGRGLRQLKQGSEQATFWQCSICNQIVAVTTKLDGEIRGAANGMLFIKSENLKRPVNVSPKVLAPEIKRERWASSWLKVNLNVS